VKLSWLPGSQAQAHNIYLGTDYTEVANATNPHIPPGRGCHTSNVYDPPDLQYGRKYYWRIDEVNESHAESPWKGKVWSFTVHYLDRGHRLLLKHGLQLQGLAFLEPGTINMERWQESNFNTFHFGSANWEVIFPGRASDHPWARWSSSPPIPEYGVYDATSLVTATWIDEHLSPSNLGEFVTWMDLMHKHLPDTISHNNDAGHSASLGFIKQYMAQAEPDMLFWDYYVFHSGGYKDFPGGSPTPMYSIMGKYRRAALAGNDGTGRTPVPYGMWYQSIKGAFGYVISETELNIQYFAPWAYGYKSLAAFIYASREAGGCVFFEGPAENNPTPLFYRAAELNRQSRNLAPALLRLLSTDVRFVLGQHKNNDNSSVNFNQLASHAREWTNSADPYITAIRASNLGSVNHGLPGDVIVGYHKPLFEQFELSPAFRDQIYFMVVNGLTAPGANGPETRQKIHMDFNFGSTGINCLYRLSRETGKVEKIILVSDSGGEYHFDFELEGGMGDLFSFHDFSELLNTEAP
jgi:hypothetical protein